MPNLKLNLKSKKPSLKPKTLYAQATKKAPSKRSKTLPKLSNPVKRSPPSTAWSTTSKKITHPKEKTT